MSKQRAASIIQFQKKQESEFICSACGADRACDCNAPALEREAARLELDRQRAAKYREKKRQRKQQPRNATGEVVTVEDDLEAHEYREAFIVRTADAGHAALAAEVVGRHITKN
jgi:hypothetical protein